MPEETLIPSETETPESEKPKGSTTIPDSSVLQRELEQAKAQLKAANAESAGRRVRLKELEEADATRKAAEMTASELSESLKSELAKLRTESETTSARAAAMSTALEAHIAGLKKDFPKHIVSLLDQLEPTKQLDYITSNRKALSRPSSSSGIDASTGGKAPAKKPDSEAIDKRKRASGVYSRF